MNNTIERLHSSMLSLRLALESDDIRNLEEKLLELGLEFACSREFIDFCRTHREGKLVLLLTTLARDNGFEPDWAGPLLALYQSAYKGAAINSIATLPQRHLLRQALACWWGGKDLPLQPEKAGRSRLASDAELRMAVEFLLDHDRDVAAHHILREIWASRDVDGFYLELIKMLLVRHRQRKPSRTNQNEWIKSYELVYTKLLGLPTLAEVLEGLSLVIAELRLETEFPESAIAWCNRVTDSKDRLKACYFEAKGRSLSGDFEGSIACLDALLSEIWNEPIDWIRDTFRSHNHSSPEWRFDDKAATVALRDLQDVLRPLKKQPFLVSGTLLGYQRVGGFLAHDKDVDVGIFSSTEDQYDIIEALDQSRVFSIQAKYLTLQNNFCIPVIHLGTGMAIDIFVYRRQGDKLITGVHTDMGYTQTFAFTPFDLQEVDFVGIKIHAPRDIDLNLTENFGDWRTPDPGYISHLESPSTMDVGGAVYMLVTRLALLKSISQSNADSGKRVCRILRTHQNKRLAMAPEVLDRIAATYGFESPEVMEASLEAA